MSYFVAKRLRFRNGERFSFLSRPGGLGRPTKRFMGDFQNMSNQPSGLCGLSRIAWSAQEKERDQMTQEALADVDANRVIDHEAMQAWAESLRMGLRLPMPS